ncbi:hypothetical protein EMPS_07590 [Entomortierella parvispora]|uniref:Uncharacterized protein n=1 Tax=Entomortierella parvispora TaxID=205924 RepID=A0A9P3LYK6_9FUNG|nr:hypothetical protein EMPS_07590 [Entomortierella parvispora]
MTSPNKIQKRRAFLEKYGSGPRAYFRREGAFVMAAITIIIIGAGALALSGATLNIGYLFLLAAIALLLAFICTYLIFHYKVTEARKTMATVFEADVGFSNTFDNTNLDRAWNDASVYVPPPPPPAFVTRP